MTTDYMIEAGTFVVIPAFRNHNDQMPRLPVEDKYTVCLVRDPGRDDLLAKDNLLWIDRRLYDHDRAMLARVTLQSYHQWIIQDGLNDYFRRYIAERMEKAYEPYCRPAKT